MKLRKLAWAALLPSGLVFFGFVLLLQSASLFARINPWLDSFVPLLFVFLMLLAWRFHRGRVVFVTLVLAGSYGVLATSLWGRAPMEQTELLFGIIGIALPLNLLLFAWLHDRGVFSIWGLLCAGGLFLQMSGLWWGLPHFETWLRAWLEMQFIANSWLDAVGFSQLVSLSFGIALSAVWICFLWRGTAVESGLAWALLSCGLALRSPEFTPHLQAYFALAGVVLLVSVLEFSYSLAYRDELTGLPARRALYELFKELGRSYVIAMVDVDHFKRFNDRHGHDVGDQVLRLVAGQLEELGGGGQAFRYGGEEFAVVFPGDALEEALPHLEELRAAIQESRFSLRRWPRPRKKPKRKKTRKGTRSLGVTVSIGVAQVGPKSEGPEAVLKAADKALYKAKRAGRNRVVSEGRAARKKSKRHS